MSAPVAERLREAVAGLPDGGSITLPVAAVQEWLNEAGNAEPDRISDLTAEDVAEELDRAPSTVRQWLAAGDIPQAYKLKGREWRVPPAALREFLDGERDRASYSNRDADLSSWRDEIRH